MWHKKKLCVKVGVQGDKHHLRKAAQIKKKSVTPPIGGLICRYVRWCFQSFHLAEQPTRFYAQSLLAKTVLYTFARIPFSYPFYSREEMKNTLRETANFLCNFVQKTNAATEHLSQCRAFLTNFTNEFRHTASFTSGPVRSWTLWEDHEVIFVKKCIWAYIY